MAQVKINIIVLGDGAVGKTSLLKMYAEKKFTESHMATLGLDYVSKDFQPPGADQELQVKIWDTAGQERFRTLTHSFYRQAQGVVVAYDVTNEESFKNVRKWMESIDEHADSNICKVMVGNKIDLVNERKITLQEAKETARSFNMEYFDASAKKNEGVKEVFETLMTQVWKKKNGGEIEERQTFTMKREEANQDVQTKKKGCC